MLSSFIKQSNNWLSVKGLISSPSAATALFSRSFSSNDCCGNNNEKCIVKPELVDVHKKGMFCFQCQETNKNTGCTIKGMCGKDAYTANLQDKLIQICKEISTACANLNDIPREVGPFLTQSLFITITNANFDSKRIKFQIRDAIKLRNSLLEKIPSKTKEDIKAPFGVKSNSNADIVSLRELITYGLKGLAAYTEHAYNLDQEDPEIYKFMVKCLAGLANDKLSIDDLVKLTLECGDCAVKAMKLLDHANTSTYGNPTVTTVNIGVGTRPGILVSGHDLRDIKDLLEQTKDQGIDIYTHGEMLPSHYYPELKKYKHLYGNYGGSWFMQDVEFGPFNGPILMTTNCIVPVKKEYKDRIFTTGVVGYEGLKHIPDRQKNGQKDFSEIIQLAKTIGKPPTQLETGHIVGGFAHNQVFALADKVVDAVKSGAIKKFVIMGGCDGRHKNRDYFTKVAEALPKDTVILTAGCAKYRYIKLPLGDINGIPRVLDAGQCNDSYSLAVIALKLKEVFGLDDVNKLPIAFDIAWYEQKAVAVLLALLALGFKNIRIGPTLPGFLSPNVANVLVNNFGISCSTTVAEDIPKLIS